VSPGFPAFGVDKIKKLGKAFNRSINLFGNQNLISEMSFPYKWTESNQSETSFLNQKSLNQAPVGTKRNLAKSHGICPSEPYNKVPGNSIPIKLKLSRQDCGEVKGQKPTQMGNRKSFDSHQFNKGSVPHSTNISMKLTRNGESELS